MSLDRARDAFAKALREHKTIVSEVKAFNRKQGLTMAEFRKSNLREARALRTELDGRKRTMDQREKELRAAFVKFEGTFTKVDLAP